jgi:hypothetical protein
MGLKVTEKPPPTVSKPDIKKPPAGDKKSTALVAKVQAVGKMAATGAGPKKGGKEDEDDPIE